MKRMNKFLFAVIFTALTLPVFAQSTDDIKRQSIESSYILAMGKKPSQGELNYWMGQNLSGNMVKSLYESHRQWLQGNTGAKTEMIKKSFKDAYGRYPDASEINKNMNLNWTYQDWMNNHTAWLRKTPADYEYAITFAYQNVMGRQPNSGELAYWKAQGAMPSYVVASCLVQCKKSSGTGMCTNNSFSPTSNYASAVVVYPEVARAANGIVGSAAGNVIAAGGGNVVAAGGGNVVASGGLN